MKTGAVVYSADTFVTRVNFTTWMVVASLFALAAFPAHPSFSLLLFLILAVFVQSTLFTFPVALIAWIARRCRPDTRLRRGLETSQVLISLLVIGFVVANLKLYDLYGFHTNFFVLNLISTPGGIEALGVSTSTWLTLVAMVVISTPLYYLFLHKVPYSAPALLRASKGKMAVAFFACLFSQSLIYAFADYTGNASVLDTADRIVWYIPVTAKGTLAELGMPRPNRSDLDIHADSGKLDYLNLAAAPVPPAPPLRPYNIVWLVAESWRADALNPSTMPNTYQFAQENLWFREHYSGGNGTRMGMFTQFYGIYGNYWFDMLQSRTPPVLMEYLRMSGYNFGAFTSSAFTYPEFDKTIFSAIPPEDLTEFSEGYGWQRDQKNTTDLISFIENSTEPFFSFMFFESSHANYYFPDEDIIEPDYLEDFNYLTADISEDITRIHNRYINATHHLDRQFARVFEALKKNNLLDNTIVVVTGDHGEEFMENGRWGHNSTFSQQQIRVPLVLHVPGQSPRTVNSMTSHLDLPATVLNTLGFAMPPDQYSFGMNLLDSNYARDFTVISDWHGNTLVTPDVKISFSLTGSAKYAGITDRDDQLIDIEGDGLAYRQQLATYAQTQNRFYD